MFNNNKMAKCIELKKRKYSKITHNIQNYTTYITDIKFRMFLTLKTLNSLKKDGKIEIYYEHQKF
jgi:hypothetical protein